jgi:histidyl-tRNA synthetase
MRDFYPEDMRLRNAVFSAWRDAARRSGFDEYDACVVESLDLLVRKAGEEIMDQIYHFKDKSGRDLALRPEMTPTLARMIAARQGSLQFPLKWFTVAQCFRYERMTRGRKREHYQWNLDILGEPSVAAEAEVIATAVNALGSMGLDKDHYRIHYSSRALLAELLLKLGIEPPHHAATFLALDKRGKIPDNEIEALLASEGVSPQAIPSVFRLLEVKTLEEARAILGVESGALAEIERFTAMLSAYGNEDIAVFNIGVIRGLSYYTGIVFEAFDTQSKLRAIFGGGRYGKLLASIGGGDISGVGLGFGDVVIAELLEELGKTSASSCTPPDYCIGFMQPEQHQVAVQIAATLRRQQHSVSLGLASEKPKTFFAKTGSAGARHAIFLGPDDLAAGTVRIKNMADRTQQEVAIRAIIQPGGDTGSLQVQS